MGIVNGVNEKKRKKNTKITQKRRRNEECSRARSVPSQNVHVRSCH